jgi:hypothetical protein
MESIDKLLTGRVAHPVLGQGFDFRVRYLAVGAALRVLFAGCVC